jgi:hypothetical protein
VFTKTKCHCGRHTSKSPRRATMSTTTDILFNSPALHSLKRDQLVKLCKIHQIKASGKNVDLVNRLKDFASTLSKDSPLSIATRSEDTSDDAMDVDGTNPMEANDTMSIPSTMHRPSEQWEIMESITEVEENSQGSLSGKTHEFGTGSSKGKFFYLNNSYSIH